MGSPKQQALDRKIKHLLTGTALRAAEWLMQDKEIQHLQDYANTVSIKRLHYNDHGQVHMRKVALNSLLLAELLHQAQILFNLEAENMGTYEDSQTAILIASFLHDVGMAVGRENHEHAGALLALPIVERLLNELHGSQLEKKVILRAIVMEGILGHMGTQKIHSIEAGVILIADGCDMEQGRARIPMMMDTESKVGDIHKYSSSAVQGVEIEKGDKKPIKITVNMTESVGFFQVEEVLFKKINSSPIAAYIELYAGVTGQKLKCYL